MKKSKMKTFLLIFGILFIIGIIVAALTEEEDTSRNAEQQASVNQNDSVNPQNEETDFIEQNDSGVIQIRGIDDDTLLENIVIACNEIGMDVSEIRNMKHIGTWVGGDIYNCAYHGNEVEFYINNDKTVHGISVWRTQVYLRGFSSLQITDYLLFGSMSSRLQTKAESAVKDALNFPSSARFSGWGYGRVVDVYVVSGKVTAENALGIRGEMNFYIECSYSSHNENLTVEYFVLDGKVIVGQSSKISDVERTEIPIESIIADDGSFELVDGVLGEFGQRVTEDGYTYIAYIVPPGKYIVTTTMNYCVVFVECIEPKRVGGFIEHDVISMNVFGSDVQSLEITVRENEWITLSMNARVTFKPID
jgi:hypothetical protein